MGLRSISSPNVARDGGIRASKYMDAPGNQAPPPQVWLKGFIEEGHPPVFYGNQASVMEWAAFNPALK
ncbi:MAG: hypothetical protein EBZ48_06135 [Proteobacteria bacterium]|nr:hypothetical protein [Pseudomonadota bacterium]